MKKCHVCKKLTLYPNISATTHYKDKKHIYYSCRKCWAKKMRIYRATNNGKKATQRAVYKSIAKYPHKQRARKLVYEALKKGTLIRPNICSKCYKHKKVEGHHPDYSKPLFVRWLCRKCHSNLKRTVV